ncbi:hypothetical protein SAMN05421678_12822 [Actinopolymorpha cephalotaxi]|uniref:DUF1269 domain-containing protein n=1 Tax=Actinopolymorpha cephalotaxi TaxID=504797 RepID=A0A1I3C0U8_9ACTN|nr:hypothetical protein [Actinopolymorpha cephalotaxi]NYH84071.1 hypothetical protein [Actinopolymorpha cephalotaxi]SFH68195.1 hypothetical protein SAMN05421678_12822 [Actinopolymorpha cephalotaxi]
MVSRDVVVSVRCDTRESAAQALIALKRCAEAGRLDLRGAIVFERRPDGGIRMPDEPDMVTGVHTGRGSLIGMIMDIFGGPLGMLLGWRGIAVIAAAADVRAAEKAGQSTDFRVSVRFGNALVVADVTEYDDTVINAEMARLGGTVIRRPADFVLDELAAAEDAAKAAETAALRVLRCQHKAERVMPCPNPQQSAE